MKKLATTTAAAALMLGSAMSTGTGPAMAGGSSDTIGAGLHCYVFLDTSDPLFAQVMVNGESGEVAEKIGKALAKYFLWGFTLRDHVGNHGSCDGSNTELRDLCAAVISDESGGEETDCDDLLP